MYAADRIDPVADEALPGIVGGLDLTVRIGAVLLFGPRRHSYVLVRQVVPSAELLGLQQRVADVCGADPFGQFAAGRWSPHVTLARRIRAEQVGAALEVLGDEHTVDARVHHCRRWDGERRTAWWLTG